MKGRCSVRGWCMLQEDADRATQMLRLESANPETSPHLFTEAFYSVARDQEIDACARCSAIVKDTTRGRAIAAAVAKTWRRVAFDDDPDVVTRFLSCNCRIASSASSSVIPGSKESPHVFGYFGKRGWSTARVPGCAGRRVQRENGLVLESTMTLSRRGVCPLTDRSLCALLAC